MKIKDLIIITIAIAVLSIATSNVIAKDYSQAIFYGVIGLPVLIYVIVAIVHETRLERELHTMQEIKQKDTNLINGHILRNEELEYKLEQLKIDFANQVKATDEAERVKEILEEKLLRIINHPLFIMHKGMTDENIPFSEDNDNTTEIYVCKDCGVEMKRHTNKIYYCDNIECQRKQWHIDKLKVVE